jgi:Putative DNA-binding domain
MAEALLAADVTGQAMPEALFAGAHVGAVGMRVHRNTMLGALANALRLGFPAVDKLVGEAFFDRMAVEYARAQPPRAPQLDEYGRDFPAFIAGFPATESLPYLRELAQFEWQFADLARCCAAPESSGPSLLLEGGVRLRFSAPLRLHVARYPVEQLRAAILTEDAAAVAGIDLDTRDYHYAMWRTEAGVNVRAASAASGRFLSAVYAGADAAAAMAAAADGQADFAIAQILAQEILPAGFVRVETLHSS